MFVTVTTADTTGEPIENASVVGEEMDRWLRDADGFEGFLLLTGRERRSDWPSGRAVRSPSATTTRGRSSASGCSRSPDVQIEEVVDYEVAFARFGPGLIAAAGACSKLLAGRLVERRRHARELAGRVAPRRTTTVTRLTARPFGGVSVTM